jgi:mRNA interferase RelE/StbE
MPWSVRFLDAARRQYLDLPERIRVQVGRKIESLEEDPFPAGLKRLKHREELYRVRIGDYRVLYSVNRLERIVTIFRIRHRRDAYRGL